MVRYYCDLCGCEDKLAHLITLRRVNEENGWTFEICEDCFNSIHDCFKDIYLMRGGTDDYSIS